MFPTQQWVSMTGGSAQRTFAPDSRDVRLVSKTSVWDAFVVYAANIDSEPGRQSSVTPQPGFPPPPSNALPVDAKIQRSLYYNQTVVLQDLATGVVSVRLARHLPSSLRSPLTSSSPRTAHPRPASGRRRQRQCRRRIARVCRAAAAQRPVAVPYAPWRAARRARLAVQAHCARGRSAIARRAAPR